MLAVRLWRDCCSGGGMTIGPALMAGGGSSGGPGGAGSGSDVVRVPNSMVGLVIGKGGENIRVIQVRCAVLIP